MFAEAAYIFRHALLRDAAYELQLPAARARLHAHAVQVLENVHGGEAPAPTPLDVPAPVRFAGHATDPLAHEIAWHAQAAGPEWQAKHRLYLRRAAEHASLQCKATEAANLWQRLAELHDGIQRAECIRRAAVEWLTIGRVEDGASGLEAALRLCRESGNGSPSVVEGAVQSNLGVLCYQTGRATEAEALIRQALAVHAAVGDKRREAISLGNLASFLQESGRIEPAEKAIAQSLELFEQVGDARYRGVAIGNLAILYQYTGREALSEQRFHESLQLVRKHGTPADLGTVLGNLATLYRDSGRHELAEAAFKEGIALLRQAGDLRMQGIMLSNYCSLLTGLRRFDDAEEAATQAIALHRQTNNQRFIGPSIGNLATVYRHSGRREAAVDVLREAIAACRQAADPDNVADYQWQLTALLLQLGRETDARAAWADTQATLLSLNQPEVIAQKRAALLEAAAELNCPPPAWA